MLERDLGLGSDRPRTGYESSLPIVLGAFRTLPLFTCPSCGVSQLLVYLFMAKLQNFFIAPRIYISDFFQTNYLNIHQTELDEISKDGRTLSVDERAAAIFLILQGTLPWQTIF